MKKNLFLAFGMLFLLAGCQQQSVSRPQVSSNPQSLVDQVSWEMALDQDTVEDINSANFNAVELEQDESLEVAQQNDSLAASLSDSSQKPGIYDNYDAALAQKFLSEGKKVLFFFWANWDPTSKALEKDILAKRSSLPENVVILKIDYDKYPDLVKKYKVISQDTVISLDAAGKEIARKSVGITMLKEIEALWK